LRVAAHQLKDHLARDLMPVYLVTGDDPLLAQESCDAIRARTKEEGYNERNIFHVDNSFDWSRLTESSQSLSLFSERRLIELRIPTGKPGDVGRAVLQAWAEAPVTDTILLVITGKLESSALKTKWVKALEAVGQMVAVYTPDAQQLPRWLEQRMRMRGLAPETGVVGLLAYHFEGNLLAADQELEKLVLLGKTRVTLEDLEQGLADQARFTVFVLVDACLRGEGATVLRILNGLRAEGLAPSLILWALAREARTLAKVSRAVATGMPRGQAMQSGGVWSRRQGIVGQALSRLRPASALALLQRAARTDRVIKGRLAGDPWQQLEDLTLAFCRVRTPVGIR